MALSTVYTTRIAQRRDKVKQGAYQGAGGPFFVRLIPDLSAAAALRQKKHKELALWHRLRAMDMSGTGVRHSLALADLQEKQQPARLPKKAKVASNV